MKIGYLLSKDPAAPEGGDLAISRELRTALAAEHEVAVVCLSESVREVRRDADAIRVPKPPVDRARLLARSLRSRRSLVHTRFDVPALVAAVDALTAESPVDRFIVEHNYMVEAFLRTRAARDGVPLLLNTVNPESSVWATTRGWIGRLELGRIRRDELRTARAATRVGCYDAAEAAAYRDHGVDARWLDVTFAPRDPVDVAAAPPRVAFVGYRDWPPNQDAFERLARWWPEIREGIPGAELVVAGLPARGAAPVPLPDGMHDLGYVDDLDALLAGCRALLAPVATGGGVRVKILDAARRGLPVVATTAAVGSLRDVLDLEPVDDRGRFVAAARRMLQDPAHAAAEGARIHAVNARRWTEGSALRGFLEWVRQ